MRLGWFPASTWIGTRGGNDDGSGGGDNALRDANAGEAYYAANRFAISHEYPPNTTHELDGRFGGIVAQQLGLYDARTNPTTTPPPTTTTPAPAAWDHTVVRSRTGATLTVDVPSGTSRTTFRVSAFPFRTRSTHTQPARARTRS